jgi:hypothetical protein
MENDVDEKISELERQIEELKQKKNESSGIRKRNTSKAR